MEPLTFRLDFRAPERRSVQVGLEFDRDLLGNPDAGAPLAGDVGDLVLFLPTWTPGSYLIREYARHLGPVVAADADSGSPVACSKISKNRFLLRVPPSTHRVRVTYTVYAHELSVRTADVTPEHAYWNHACLLLWPLHRRECATRILVQLPAGWRLATTLPRTEPADGLGPGSNEIALSAHGLDEVMDSPCLAGTFSQIEWLVRGVPHSIALDGLGSIQPPPTLIDDLTALIDRAAAVFGNDLPYAQYQFHCLFTDDGHGGLEHADSTTLLAARTAMHPGKAHQQFLSLAAHEFFHVWNVKRMRPQELWRYDYEVENYTPMLWLAEGFTAYYDDLLCLRAGILSVPEYLAILAKSIGTVLGSMGRHRQSLGEASFDAWIRLYRPDENTKNSTQNYYVHGSIAALVLDLTIRRTTGGARSLDDAMRHLWQSTFLAGRGYSHADVVAALSVAAGIDMGPALDSLVGRSLDPDLRTLLGSFALTLVNGDRDKPYLGISFQADSTRVSFVNEDGPAYSAGIAPGDEILALDGLRVQSASWAEVFGATAAIGRSLRVLTSSRGRIVERTVTPIEMPVGSIGIETLDEASPAAVNLRKQWLEWPSAKERRARSPG